MEKIISILINIGLFGLVLLFMYIGHKFAISKAKKEKMSKIDFSKEKEYYREILAEYSPIELSYIDNFTIDEKRDIVATLLSLKLKRRIKIEDNNIKIIDPSKEDLKRTEVFVLENIIDGKVQIKDMDYLEIYAEQEAYDDKLLEKNETAMKKANKKLICGRLIQLLIIMIFIIFSLNVDKFNQSNILTFIGIFIILGFAFVILLIFPMINSFTGEYKVMQLSACARTKKGEEINRKLEGLKKYEKDFTLLHEKEQNELVLWEEYLIYSAMFNNNSKIVKEFSKLIIK